MKEKNSGVSLVYVLIVLSLISIFSVNFVYFVKQKSEINSIKNEQNTDVNKEYLLFLEEENAKKLVEDGAILDENSYFNTVKVENNGVIEFEKLIYFNKGTESFGNFQIKKVIDNEGNEYNLPFEKNQVYKNLEVFYVKNVLNTELIYKEEINFKRIDAMNVEVVVIRK